MSPVSFHYGSHKDDESASLAGDSDREPTILNTFDNHYFSRCYWSGKIFVQYILSDVVFRSSPASWGGVELEAELAQSIIDFPYANCVEQLDAMRAIDVPSSGSLNGCSGHWIFMTKIGVMLTREPELKTRLVSMIQTRGGTVHVNLDATEMFPPSPSDSSASEVDEGNRIAMFTMKLNEWCAKRRNHIQYDDEHLSIDPPQFEVHARVGGSTYTGRARTKAKARHIASKQACEALDIRV